MTPKPRSSLTVRRVALVLVGALAVAMTGGTTAAAAPATRVTGWSTAPLAVAPQSVVRLPIRVVTRGERRVRWVRVQVRRSRTAAWSKPRWRRTNARGRIVLRWRAPARKATRFLRVQVRRGPAGHKAAVTRARRVRVVAPTPPPPIPDPDPDFQSEVVRLTNVARSRARTCGGDAYPAVGPVAAHSQLAAAAQGHAEDMATQDYFAHDSLDGRTPWDRIRATGYVYSSAGENIAAGYWTPEEVVAGWLDSPGHCSNIMNAGFTELGVGYATSSTASYPSYWVQNFARPAR